MELFEDCDQLLSAKVNKITEHKTNRDVNLFYSWARQNLEMRKIQDIPTVELDSLLARMYLGM